MTPEQIMRLWRQAMQDTPGKALPIEAFAALARADLEADVKVLEKELGNTVSMARADDLIAERDAWKQAHDEQVALLNKIASERDELKAEVELLNTSESNLSAHVGALARLNGRKDAVLLNMLEFCEFLWRDVALNDYASEKLDAAIEAITKEIK